MHYRVVGPDGSALSTGHFRYSGKQKTALSEILAHERCNEPTAVRVEVVSERTDSADFQKPPKSYSHL